MGFLDKIFGIDDSRRELREGRAAADRRLAASLEQGRREREGRLDESLAALQPFTEAGRDANRLSRAALGLDGREAQTAFFDDFKTDPGFQRALQSGIDALDRSAASRGLLFSGAQGKDIARFVTDRTLNDAFDKRLNRLLQLQGQGEGLARTEATLHDAVGSDLFDARLGIGQQQAGLDIGLANALADSRQAGVNRLFDTVNSIGRVVAAF